MSSTPQDAPQGNRQEPAATPSAGKPSPDTPARKPNRRRILIALAVLALLGGAIWLLHWWTVGRFIESTDDAYLQADSMTAAPKVSGYVTDVYVGDNQPVKAGAPLVRLDVRQYQVALQQARATVDARRADIARAEADIAQQRANLEQAQAQARVSSINLHHASDEYARYAPLAATGAETRERIADLRNTRDQAQATLAANTASIAAARTQIAASTAQLQQARAQLEAAQASAAQSQLDLDNTVVRSTLDGRVGDRTVRVGQYVQPGTRLLTVVPVQSLYLVANFKETQLGRMRPGQPVTLHVDALPGRELHGRVESFAPGTGAQFALLPPENATGNFTKIVQRVPVRIHVDTDDQARRVLLPGLSVTVDVDTRDDGNQHG
ncbi:HlyD family secretion protein [Burkholderia glumae]|uniref:HlyD family secretion protein n=1 Tax=Burkholderia glumae TaxID=337 RepID=A0AAQ0BS47_BURGL|nr:HlyD family secretion protein [Burkholderia glumae]ACR30088.1 Multidrug resistance efflux pump [Burkholderia glumae BGR1]AJY66799.1 efflux transporter, RND family, MFP subunit [Burkholderia glumae LMG 2196 = ATCC 33617]KHJ62384.1 multidrug ABC transporter permease [Burkholderia glumae]MCM2482269.1 HlyD family secretion protein [Burkholderia glumae]MCM2491134.1 HlyD family secretion protein [Burkholderia glumae]